jgi:TetR/AcrR family transcriptional repressor of mexJK operon
VTTAAPRPVARPRGGRPSLDEAAKLGDRILDAATELLLSQGYGATSVEAVARRARVSKRTLYSRFRDKPALTAAAIRRLIDRHRPSADAAQSEDADLDAVLERLASRFLNSALDPQVLALHRLIVAESERFPDLAAAVTNAGGRQQAVGLIGGLLQRHRPDAIGASRAEFLAQQFIQMVISLPQLRALGLGRPMSAAETDAWVRDTVSLYLRGI